MELQSLQKIRSKNSLENEKMNFLKTAFYFLENIDFENQQINGRPKTSEKELLKHLLVMSYNAMSYRRAISDLKILYDKGYVQKIISKSTLNDFANRENTILLLERLIQVSSTFVKDREDTLIVDSTWFGEKMYVGGHGRVHSDKGGLSYTRKIHVGILKNSKVICYAKATPGTRHDSPLFKEILINSSNLFNLKYCLGDKGYCSKENYVLCYDKNITAFLDFKSNCKSSGGKSSLWKQQIDIWKDKPELWHDSYRFRVIIEGVFSVIKKKHNSYLRARNQISRDIEMLLKCLVYNFSIIGKEMNSDTFRT